MKAHQAYREGLIAGFWAYVETRFPDSHAFFDPPAPSTTRLPVFVKSKADSNIIIAPGTSPEKAKQILREIPRRQRHRWFRSMASSQALAQSLFGNLRAHDSLSLLDGITDDEGRPLFDGADLSAANLTLEHTLDCLGEPLPTSVDVFIAGHHRIAIECKLTEQDVGVCSSVGRGFCNGTYRSQAGRKERCYLKGRGILYWKYIPELFSWENKVDHDPCPLNSTYQLVRNVLAACVGSNGQISPDSGHAVLIYDERNPEFQAGGKGMIAYEKTLAALRYPRLLRTCSWQRILGKLKRVLHIQWLADEIELKYGIPKMNRISNKNAAGSSVPSQPFGWRHGL